MLTRMLVTVLALFCCLPSLRAEAASVLVEFSGVITDYGDPDGMTDASIGNGTRLSGSVAFESTAAPSEPLETYYLYEFSVPPWAMTLSVGDYAYHANATIGASVQDRPVGAPESGDGFGFNTTVQSPNQVPGSDPSLILELVIVPISNDFLSSNSLADVPWGLVDLEHVTGYASMYMASSQGVFVGVATLDSLAVTVPEPEPLAAAGLLLLALAQLANGTKRRSLPVSR